GELVEQLGDLGGLGILLDRLLYLPVFLLLGEHDVAAALADLDAANVFGLEARQLRVAEAVRSRHQILELVRLDLKDLLESLIAGLKKGVAVGDRDLPHAGRLAETARRRRHGLLAEFLARRDFADPEGHRAAI